MVPLHQRDLLDDIEEQLRGGADFSALAKAHSQCPSAQRGGDVGWLRQGQYFPEVEQVAFSTPVGALGRATSAGGHHLLKVMDSREDADVQHLSVQELGELLDNPILCEEVQFVDVREEGEHQTARLPYFRLFPLSSSADWAPHIDELLDPEKETVVLCHHGVRSMNMAQFLVSRCFKDVKNVTGGIDAYSRAVDRSVPLY